MNTPQYVIPTKETNPGFVYTETSDTCPFCEKEKIISGIYLQIGAVGTPCCNTCYNKEGFNEWFVQCEAIRTDIPKQLDWFIDMYYRRGLTPQEAIDDMLLVV